MKNKRGISLIVLVITIIVMIILATAIILSLSSSGIISKANDAVTSSDEANAKHVVNLAKAEYDLMSEKEKDDVGGFKSYAESKLNEAGFNTGAGKNSYVVTETGELINSGINTIYIDSNDELVIIPRGFVASSASGENTVEGGLVIYEGTDPVTDSNVSTAQTTRNQFVWIPVPDIAKFQRTTKYNGTITDPGYSYKEPASIVCEWYDLNSCVEEMTLSLTNDLTGEWKEEAAMRASVEKYGGFYIGRYEAGTTTARVDGTEFGTTDVLVQKNKPVYDHVGWGTAMYETTGDIFIANAQGKGAVELARGLYNTSSVKSTLTYGVQWDATMNFMKDVENPNYGYVNGSTRRVLSSKVCG